MRRARNYKNIIILGVFVALFVMTVGYATYQKRLDIGGVANVNNGWNIKIASIETIETSNAIDIVNPSHTNTTAKFNSKITSVGGYIKYKVTIKNIGTIDGILGAININETENSVITYNVEGTYVDDELLVGEEVVVYVTATYDSQKIDTASTNKSNVSINFTYVQLEGYTKSEPTIVLNDLPSTMTKGYRSIEIISSFNPGASGGEAQCNSNIDGIVSNINTLSRGNHTLTCTVTSNNGNTVTETTNINITYEPYTITNLVYNGNFNNGIDGWYAPEPSNSLTAENGMAKWVNGYGGDWQHFGSAYSIINANTANHEYYIQTRAKTESYNSYFGIGDLPYGAYVYVAINYFIPIGQLTTIGTVFNPAAGGIPNGAYIGFFDRSAHIGETVYIDYFLAVDLTATFGAGNEPDQEWCDTYISYFDGSTTIYK